MKTFYCFQASPCYYTKPTRNRNALTNRKVSPTRFAWRRPRVFVASASSGSEKVSKVLVLGGTGRVGTETIEALTGLVQTPIAITVAGRNVAQGEAVCRELSETHSQCSSHFQFSRVDLQDTTSLQALITNHDLVIHTAGPFQKRKDPAGVLRTAMDVGVPYMDICDDLYHSMECKKLDSAAKEAGYTALISTGIYPGLSNLMAVEAVSMLEERPVESLKLYYHTAGSGGIGATVLASTFLILGEKAVCFDKAGKKSYLPAGAAAETVDFKGKIGKKTTYLLNLPEVVSLKEVLFGKHDTTEVFAKFSTAPPIWNWLMQVMARLVPDEWLTNRDAMMWFAKFSLPIVKAVDKISGARTGIKVVASGAGRAVEALYEHEKLAKSVGEATAAFAVELLNGAATLNGNGGVLFPEELDDKIRRRIFDNATTGADVFRTERS